ncbi:MAG: hypothetical protein MHMPM18_004281 [Marteilia pararefringens]
MSSAAASSSAASSSAAAAAASSSSSPNPFPDATPKFEIFEAASQFVEISSPSESSQIFSDLELLIEDKEVVSRLESIFTFHHELEFVAYTAAQATRANEGFPITRHNKLSDNLYFYSTVGKDVIYSIQSAAEKIVTIQNSSSITPPHLDDFGRRIHSQFHKYFQKYSFSPVGCVVKKNSNVAGSKSESYSIYACANFLNEISMYSGDLHREYHLTVNSPESLTLSGSCVLKSHYFENSNFHMSNTLAIDEKTLGGSSSSTSLEKLVEKLEVHESKCIRALLENNEKVNHQTFRVMRCGISKLMRNLDFTLNENFLQQSVNN